MVADAELCFVHLAELAGDTTTDAHDLKRERVVGVVRDELQVALVAVVLEDGAAEDAVAERLHTACFSEDVCAMRVVVQILLVGHFFLSWLYAACAASEMTISASWIWSPLNVLSARPNLRIS